MKLEELQYIAEIAGTYDLDFPDQMDEFYDNVYTPIRKAIANNDKNTIAFIEQCSKEKKYHLFTGVSKGVDDSPHPESIALYKHLCKELGVEVDARITA